MQDVGRQTLSQGDDAVAVAGEVDGRFPGKAVGQAQGRTRQHNFYALVGHLPGVQNPLAVTAGSRNIHRQNLIARGLIVIRHVQADTAF